MSKEVRDEKPKRKKSIFRRFMGTILWAFILGFLLLLTMNAFEWYSKGYDTMMNDLQQHYQTELNSLMIRNAFIGSYSMAALQFLDNKISSWIMGSEEAAEEIHLPHQFLFVFVKEKSVEKSDVLFSGALTNSLKGAQKIGGMLWASFLVLSLKFISVLAAFLIYLFAALFGALDGLVVRYIRTAEGGRESTFIFHKMTETIVKIPALLIMLYLISPILINPTLVIILLASSFFLVFNIATANLKKFL